MRASGLRRRTQLTKCSISASMKIPPEEWNGWTGIPILLPGGRSAYPVVTNGWLR